jgi:predicted DNA-binding transcriptional regulator YafY
MEFNASASGNPYDELKRTSRILELAQLIAAQPRHWLRRDLARRFDVSERMIQKDLDILRYGLKLSLAHTAEGYYFDEIPRLPTLQYSFNEALALFLAVQAGSQIQGVVSADLAAAMARLEALFPPEIRPLLHAPVHSDAALSQGQHRGQMLARLNLAMSQGRKLNIEYETRSRGGDVSQRVVRPYALIPYVRSWQLVAYCEWREKILIFKVDRILRADLCPEHYTIPADFRLEDYMGSGWGMMRGNGADPSAVTLRFERDAGRRVAEEYWHASQRFEDLPDGRVLLRLRVGITPEFVHWILYYGAEVEVLEPEGLREEVIREIKKHREVYSI